jgi:hypothetical protein
MKHKWLSFLLLPALLLVAHYLTHEFEFHSDDVYYWQNVVEWKRKFDILPPFQVLWEIHGWNAGRASYHLLWGVPFLYVAGSVQAATITFGLFFTLISTICSYLILRKFKVIEWAAALGAAAACSHSFLIGSARAFLPELPFCALSLMAVLFLLSEKISWFCLFYSIAMLCRPFEAVLLIPFAWLFYNFRQVKTENTRNFNFALAILTSFLITALAFCRRSTLFQKWVDGALFPQSQEHAASSMHFGISNLMFVTDALYVIFGISGLILFAGAFYSLWKNRNKAEPNPRLVVGIFILLCLVLLIVSTIEVTDTRVTYNRYTISFVMMATLMASAVLFRLAPKNISITLVTIYLGLNILVCTSGIVGRMLYPGTVFAGSTNEGFNRYVFHAYDHGAEALAKELKFILPPRRDAIVLFAGRDPELLKDPELITLRLAGKWPYLTITDQPIEPHLQKIFNLESKEGHTEVSKYHIDGVIFARHELMPGSVISPYPNAPMVEALEKNQESHFGLRKAKTIEWIRQGKSQTLELYIPAGAP